ncbi:MAG: copper resistance protein CopC [Gammaproteobacteria bacterium]|nr:copper resistance protein CopC [Pseudomonadales bacterium]MCP5345783.1 copper resistance protein CopC [Pseudomonadales bacterium]
MDRGNYWRKMVRSMLVATAFLGFMVTAQAHTGLHESIPGDGAVVKTAPEQISLQFTEAVSLVKFAVHDHHGDALDLGFQPQTTPRTEYQLPATLVTGAYHVEWAAIGADGHTVTGTFGFTVDPDAEMDHAGHHAEAGHHDASSGHHDH